MLFAVLVSVFVVSLLLACILLRLKERRTTDFQVTGNWGENIVADILTLLSESYRVINDLVLKTNKGYSQIDHIVISNYGVFVIETKNYSGWIYGSESKQHWKQTFRRSSYEFYNPIFQNKGHIMALRAQLPELYRVQIVPIVVFTGDCELKVYTPNVPVIKKGDLISTINSYSEVHIDDATVEDIYTRLVALNKSEEYSKTGHIQQIRQREQEAENRIAAGRCPQCGGYLVERKGKYGKFYGCSNYPKCKFIHN